MAKNNEDDDILKNMRNVLGLFISRKNKNGARF